MRQKFTTQDEIVTQRMHWFAAKQSPQTQTQNI